MDSSKTGQSSDGLEVECQNLGDSRRAEVISCVAIVVGLVMYARPQEISGQLILVVGSVLVVLSLWRGLAHPRLMIVPWIFVGLAFSSILWNDDFWTVITRSAALAVPLMLAGLIAKNVPFERFLDIADYTLKAIVVASLLVAVLIPAVGLTQDPILQGTFRGIFIHRNHMGYVALIAVITLLARNWKARKSRFGTVAWMVVYIFALSWTGSAGAVVLVFTSLCLYGLVRWLAGSRTVERGLLLMSSGFLLGFVTLLALPHAPKIIGLLGRDMTFTNRVEIWQGALQAWDEEFWFGYGWGSILGADDHAANVISRTSGWMVTSTHNGYLSTALQLGAVGLTVAVLFLSLVLLKTLKMVVIYPGAQAVWSLQIVVVLIVGDFTETRAFANIGWFLLCLVAYYSAQSVSGRSRDEKSISYRPNS